MDRTLPRMGSIMGRTTMAIEQQGTLDFEGERTVVAGDGRGSLKAPPNDASQFHAHPSEKPEAVLARLRQLFEAVKQRYPGVFDPHEDIRLNAKAVKYVVGQLQPYSLLETDKDAVGEAFEAFLGPSLRGEKGQFFTPRSVVRMIVDLLDPQPDERIIDPACGSGGFLIATLEHIWQKIGGPPSNDMCVRLLAEGGRMAMVLPEGLFGNRSSGYVLAYLRARCHHRHCRLPAHANPAQHGHQVQRAPLPQTL